MSHDLIRQAAAEIHNAYAQAYPSLPDKTTLTELVADLKAHVEATFGPAAPVATTPAAAPRETGVE